MVKNLERALWVVAGLLLVAGAAWWWLYRPLPPPVELFSKLPAGFIVAWQANWASLRRSILIRQALQRASSQRIDPTYMQHLDQADWISGVILPGGRSAVAMYGQREGQREGQGLAAWASPGTTPGTGTADARLRELGPLPQGKDFWLVLDPRSPGPFSIGPMNSTTVEFPSELLNSARRIVAYGNIGTLSMELNAEAEYASAADAARLASTLNGFLGLLRNLSRLSRKASVDQGFKLFWESLEVRTEGNSILLHAQLDEAGVVRMLLLPSR